MSLSGIYAAIVGQGSAEPSPEMMFEQNENIVRSCSDGVSQRC
jgi:hypothetical protein